MVGRGLASGRRAAQELIARRQVLVSGTYADKPARLVAASEPIEVVGDLPRYVGRGGEKLAAALDRFGVDPSGRVCLDAGSSTGGFTDCLLQRGAARVTAVDVGRGQLHPRLRQDERVDVRERTDIRSVEPGGPVSLLVADLSFIGLGPLVTTLLDLSEPDADLVLLVKPQFEAGAAAASKGRGVIRDPDVWRSVLVDVMAAVHRAGAAMMGAMVSPLRGAAGNVEFFVHVRADGDDDGWDAEAAAEDLARSAAEGAP